MFKKCFAIVLLSFSAILMVGHDIIPHQHDENNEHHHHAAKTHQDEHAAHLASHHSASHETSDDNSPIGDLLSHFTHTSDYTLHESSEIHLNENSIDEYKTTNVAVMSNIMIVALSDTKSIGYHYKGPGYLPPYSNSTGLRAPPVFFS